MTTSCLTINRCRLVAISIGPRRLSSTTQVTMTSAPSDVAPTTQTRPLVSAFRHFHSDTSPVDRIKTNRDCFVLVQRRRREANRWKRSILVLQRISAQTQKLNLWECVVVVTHTLSVAVVWCMIMYCFSGPISSQIWYQVLVILQVLMISTLEREKVSLKI